MHNIPSIHLIPKNVSPQKIEQVLNRYQSNTGRLAQILHIKVNARVMLTVNINIKDRLKNGQLDTVMHIANNHGNEVFKISVQFDDNTAGLKKLNTDKVILRHNWYI